MKAEGDRRIRPQSSNWGGTAWFVSLNTVNLKMYWNYHHFQDEEWKDVDLAKRMSVLLRLRDQALKLLEDARKQGYGGL